MPSNNILELKKLIGASFSEEILVKALDGVTASIIVVDSEINIYFVNTATELLFGYTRGELIGQHVNLLVPDDVKEQHLEYIKKYVTDPKLVMLQREMGRGLVLRGRRKDGSEFPVTVDISPVQTRLGLFVVTTVKLRQ